jgi:HEPN domain-containing protein
VVDEPEYERWLAAARDAGSSARAQRTHGAFQWCCFLAEQGAQLAVKGLLHGVGAGGWGHDLAVLTSRAGTALALTLPEDLTDAALRLSRHYIAARYPDAHPAGTPGGHYSKSDADTAIADLHTVFGFVEREWTALLEATVDGDDRG